MKVIIVDDELLVRIGIKSCIEWDKYGIELVGEASDGIEALQLVMNLKPDVMLLDLKMPNMDGIELMKKLRDENLKCKILVLSGFDDIYHVKEAMKLGAVDYLHKPCMDARDVLNVLVGIKKQLETEISCSNIARADIGGANKGIHMHKESFLKELLTGHTCSEAEFERKCREYNVKLGNGYFSCIVFKVNKLEDVKKRYADQDASLLNTSILNVLNGVFDRESGTEVLQTENGMFSVITGIKGIISERKVMESIQEAVRLTADALRQLLDIDISMGVSDIHISYHELKRAFDEACMALKYKFYMSNENTIHYRSIRQYNNSNALLKVDKFIEKLKGCLTRNDYERFSETLRQFVELLQVEPCLSEEDVKKLFNAFLFLIEDGKAGFEEMKLLGECETLVQLYTAWKDITHIKMKKNSAINRYKDCCYLVKGILVYIDDNYSQDITLNLLAENFNVTPNYISRIFREETGEPLFTYLNRIRVEKAKELLKDNTMKIYEIGYKVGFKSPVHFNIVFNKLEGMSPKQYRDSL